MPNGFPLTFHPLIPERWGDFEALFGPKGACAGCWCMWWRLANKDFEACKGEGNRQAMKALVETGTVPGILAYLDGTPAAGGVRRAAQGRGGLRP